MKLLLWEACADDSAGSIGAHYVAEHARRAGFTVDVARRPRSGYDVELVSVHHCDDFPIVAQHPQRAPIRILGGHPLQNNPRPVIPFADALCVGEGESWIKAALPIVQRDGHVRGLATLPGTILTETWERGQPLPTPNYERPLPDNDPYLNHAGTRSAAWYLEIARGCPYGCAFCELGNSAPFRLYSYDYLVAKLNMADTRKTRKINFYAPDEVSHPQYHELFDYLMQKGYSASFSSMRVESVLRRGLPPTMKTNHLIRIGVDGLTAETRRSVNKPITDDQIVEYFRLLIDRGHVQFKMFMIFGYPWETPGDFAGFETLMSRLFALELSKNISLRIKWTPFIPQPCTPLADVGTQYDRRMVDKINVWHALNARPRTEPGWFVENDGLMSEKSHRRQVVLTAGNEMVLARDYDSRYPQFGR